MCGTCEGLTGAPATGYMLARGTGVTYAGQDPAVAALTVPGRLPADGLASVATDGRTWRVERFLPGTTLQDARRAVAKAAAASGHPAVVAHVVYAGGTLEKPVALLKASEVITPGGISLAGLPGQLVRVEKARKLDPLKPGDFDKIVAALGSLMTKKAGAVEKAAMADFMDSVIDFDWVDATDASMLKASKALNSAMRKATPKTWAAIEGNLEVSVLTTGQATAASVKTTYELEIASRLAQKDVAALRRAAAAQAHFVRDHYGDMARAGSATMRRVVEDGLDKGLGRNAIGRNIQRTLGQQMPNWTSAYFNTVSSAVTGRSRSFSELTSYKSAGIAEWMFEAVLDRVTTDTCRLLHSRVFGVSAGLDAFAATDALDDPRDVKYTQPWTREKGFPKDHPDHGKKGIFINSREGWKQVAVIEKSAFGQNDKTGTYSKVMSPKQMADANINQPPLHGRCLLPKTPVMTSRGFIPAERLCNGDMVLTHSGLWRPITYVGWSWYTGDVTVFQTPAGHTAVTNDHPTLAADLSWLPAGETNGKTIHLDYEIMRYLRRHLRGNAEPPPREILFPEVPECWQIPRHATGDVQEAIPASERGENLQAMQREVHASGVVGRQREGHLLLNGLSSKSPNQWGIQSVPRVREAGLANPEQGESQAVDLLLRELPQQGCQDRATQARYKRTDVGKEKPYVWPPSQTRRMARLHVSNSGKAAPQKHMGGRNGEGYGRGGDPIPVRAAAIRGEEGNVSPRFPPPGSGPVPGGERLGEARTLPASEGVQQNPWPASLGDGAVVSGFHSSRPDRIVRGRVVGVRVYSFDVPGDETFVSGCGIVLHNCRSRGIPVV